MEKDIPLKISPRSLLLLDSTYITTCPPDWGAFIFLKLDVILFLKATPIIQLSNEENAIVLAE